MKGKRQTIGLSEILRKFVFEKPGSPAGTQNTPSLIPLNA
jgi:hypothetical protein